MVTYIGRRQDLDATFTTLLEAGATIAYRRCRALYGCPKDHVLTRQQRKICSWLALGKTSAEIGEILGIREATVDQHVRQSKSRLGTPNRTSTVIEAIRRSLKKIR
ncbi:response regulator transcription factor [Agrobacterium tumefaciens]